MHTTTGAFITVEVIDHEVAFHMHYLQNYYYKGIGPSRKYPLLLSIPLYQSEMCGHA